MSTAPGNPSSHCHVCTVAVQADGPAPVQQCSSASQVRQYAALISTTYLAMTITDVHLNLVRFVAFRVNLVPSLETLLIEVLAHLSLVMDLGTEGRATDRGGGEEGEGGGEGEEAQEEQGGEHGGSGERG